MRTMSRNPFRGPCEPPALPALRQWYRQPLGQALQDRELEAVRAILPTLFGYHLAVVDSPWPDLPQDALRIRNAWHVDSTRGAVTSLLGEAGRLPVRTDCLDAIVLPHVLEFSSDPHAILREADRCLVPEGHLLILGFQPWGLWGLRRLASAWRGQPPWCGRWLSVGRVRDWCRLLGFDVLEIRHLFHRPPISRTRIAARALFLERLAERGWPLPTGVWLLLARKRVIGLTPIRPRWRPRRSILSPLPGVAEPTRRSCRK